MLLQLRRFKFLPERTAGLLFIDGVFECFTLEDTVRPDGVKIAGKTAIPAGTYSIVPYYSPKFNRKVPLFLDVPDYDHIEIHPGNTEENTEGCILIGDALNEDFTIKGGTSRPAFDRLMSKIEICKIDVRTLNILSN